MNAEERDKNALAGVSIARPRAEAEPAAAN
jgi:hypothetical protein